MMAQSVIYCEVLEFEKSSKLDTLEYTQPCNIPVPKLFLIIPYYYLVFAIISRKCRLTVVDLKIVLLFETLVRVIFFFTRNFFETFHFVPNSTYNIIPKFYFEMLLLNLAHGLRNFDCYSKIISIILQ